ncbi:MAG: hypothetical protein HY558_04175 [Euryarchaeota archaeon]|nr:hypothetical protein [Euryarchaeota archaeon]
MSEASGEKRWDEWDGDDKTTHWWLNQKTLARLLMAPLFMASYAATYHYTDNGRLLDRLVTAESVFFLMVGLFMLLHHRLAKGVWMHTREIPICHGFMGTGIMAGSLVFMLTGLGVFG